MLARPQAELAVPGSGKLDTVGVFSEFFHGTDTEGQEHLWAQFGGAALQQENIQQLHAGAQETCKHPQAPPHFPQGDTTPADKFSVTVETSPALRPFHTLI